jgi:recombination protein RecA
MSKLETLIKEINKDYKEQIATIGIPKINIQKIPFGSIRLNYMAYGGIPRNKLIEFAGVEASGKEQPIDAKVVTPTGFVEIGSIKKGDEVMGDDGHAHRVLGVFPQGIKPVYQVVFTDGSSTRCGLEHLWRVQSAKQRIKGDSYYFVKSLGELISMGTKVTNMSIPLTKPVQYPEASHKLDAYFLGLLLGDGGFTCNTLTFTNAEDDLIDAVSSFANIFDCELHTRNFKNHKQCNIVERRKSNQHPIKHILNELGLLTLHSGAKFIPEIYKIASIEQRVRLLTGIINTGGNLSKRHGEITISTSSEKLCIDIKDVANSLGLYVSVHSSQRLNRDSVEYVINLGKPDIFNNLLSKKHYKKIGSDTNRQRRRRIKEIKYLYDMECVCISVSNPSKLYLTDDFIVTHNTTTSLDIVAQCQKLFPIEHQEEIASLEKITKRKKDEETRLKYLQSRGAKKIVYCDCENTLDEEWAIKLDVDVESMIILKPQTQNAEQIFQMLLDIIETDEVGLIVIDSLAVMMSAQAFEKTVEDKTYGGISTALTLFSKKAINSCGKHNCTIIAINQVREDMKSTFGGLTTPGGKAWKHNCSMRLMFNKGNFIDAKGNEIKRNSESPVGNIVEVSILKTKFCKSDRRAGFYTLNYDTGIDAISDLIDVCLKVGVIVQSGAWFQLVDVHTGELIADENNEVIKLQGKHNVKAYLKQNPEFVEELTQDLKPIINGTLPDNNTNNNVEGDEEE